MPPLLRAVVDAVLLLSFLLLLSLLSLLLSIVVVVAVMAVNTLTSRCQQQQGEDQSCYQEHPTDSPVVLLCGESKWLANSTHLMSIPSTSPSHSPTESPTQTLAPSGGPTSMCHPFGDSDIITKLWSQTNLIVWSKCASFCQPIRHDESDCGAIIKIRGWLHQLHPMTTMRTSAIPNTKLQQGNKSSLSIHVFFCCSNTTARPNATELEQLDHLELAPEKTVPKEVAMAWRQQQQ
jgi:hypothetical protein